MPAQSQQQQKLFGLALAFKRGEVPASEVSDEIKAIADRMSEKEIEDFAATKHKGLPKMKEQLRKIVREIMRERAITELEESYKGNMSDFKYEFPNTFENETGNSSKAIKKISKKGKGYEVRTSIYMSEPEMKKVGDAMGLKLVNYQKSSNIAVTLYESQLPNAMIPSNIKVKLNMAIDKIKDTNLTYNQKLQVIGKIIDSLGIDKKELVKMSTRLRGTLESVNEGKKVFKVNPGIGKVKYSISSHDGVKKHKDGSDFFDIETFKNKVDLEKAIKKYTSNGFKMESVNEARVSIEAASVANLTGTRNLAVQDFIDAHNLDARKLYKHIKSGSLKDRMEFVTALAGKPGNPIQTKVIKMFGESVVNEGFSTEEKRIVLMAVKKISKYMNVDLPTAMNYLLGAGQELERDIKKGKIK
jgi:hypothetical protein